MKKIFALLMMVLAFSATANAQNKWTIKAGFGVANVNGLGVERVKLDLDNTFSWKIGAGYEVRVNELIGIEPSAFLVSKGSQSDDEKWNPLTLDIPIMCNFHVTENVVLGVGPYVGIMINNDDMDGETKASDFGLRTGVKYVFDNGLNLGLDGTFGLTDVTKDFGGNHFGLWAVVGYSF